MYKTMYEKNQFGLATLELSFRQKGRRVKLPLLLFNMLFLGQSFPE